MIRTERLSLRPPARSDRTALHAIFSDPRAMRFWDRPAWQDMAQTDTLLKAFMEDAPRDHLERAVDLDGTLIGRVGMWKRYEIGYILHTDHWGRGYATEAMTAFMPELETAFPEAPVFTAEIDPRNTGSARLPEKLGFVHVRSVEKNFLYGGTEWTDTAYYERQGPAAV